jgi:mono/diheme cytochrome c family protein
MTFAKWGALVAFGWMVTPVAAQVAYSTQIQPIFNSRCTSCHGGISGVTLTSYASTMASVGNFYDKKIVTPGNADASPLFDKLQAVPQFGSQMPQGGTLSVQQIQLIRTWINEGATETPTSLEEPERPMAMRLDQNFPNPFNPNTVIRFNVGTQDLASLQVRLSVVDMTGREVAVLVDGMRAAGEHSVTFDATGLPSGIYMYVLESGGQRVSRKLLLMK